MNQDIEIMIKMYETYDEDWMGDKINSIRELTRHHIVKKEDDGKDCIYNYAILTQRSHYLLHYLETNYNYEYNYLNQLFLELNRSLKKPTFDYYQKVKEIIKKVKKDIKNKRRGRKR